MKTNRVFLFGVIFSSIFWYGCGGAERPSDLPPLCPTVVKLTQEGQPLADAMVSFHSADPAFKWSVAATTDASGTATLKTHSQFPGVPAGEYKVVVRKTETPDVAAPVRDGEESGKNVPRVTSIVLYHLVDAKFAAPETTPISMTVKKGKNVQTFDVGKPVHEKAGTIEP